MAEHLCRKEKIMDQNDKKIKLSENFFSNLLLVVLGILCYMGLSHLDVVRGVLGSVLAILSPFLAGAVIAYLLDYLVRAIERGPLRGHRGFCVLLAYLIAVLVIGGLLLLVVPQLLDSVRMLLNNIPAYLSSAELLLDDLFQKLDNPEQLETIMGSYEEIIKKVTAWASGLLPQVFSYGKAIGTGLISAVTALISSIYMLLDKEKLLRQMRKMVFSFLPEVHANRVLLVCGRTNQVFGGFLGGKIIDSAIIGLLCFLLSSLLRIPYALLVSVVVGCTNIIPFFGPFLGAIPCAFILLIVNPFSAFEFILMILVLQQFDGNILGPKILGNSTGLSALWVLFAIIVGGDLFGFVGMLVGVPSFAVLYSLVAELMDKRLAAKGIDAAGHPVQTEEPAEVVIPLEEDEDMKIAP